MIPAEKPKACRDCPAYRWGVGFVPPEGPLDAKMCAIGQGPGEMEARFSRPFFPNAPSGQMLTELLVDAGWRREDTLITNVVWCWLPRRYNGQLPEGNRSPTQAELEYCGRHHLWPLLREADILRPDTGRVILTIGAPATAYIEEVTGSVDKYIGTFQQRDLRKRAEVTGSAETVDPGVSDLGSSIPDGVGQQADRDL